jgi:hypothetical protein
MSETGEPTDDEPTLSSWVEQRLAGVRRLAAYAQEAQREGTLDLGELLRRAQAEARRRPESTTGAGESAPPDDGPAAADPRPAGPSHDEIAQRAFAIYQRERGDDVENWLRAERELREYRQEAAKREPDPPAPGES